MSRSSAEKAKSYFRNRKLTGQESLLGILKDARLSFRHEHVGPGTRSTQV
jgi:hypothetical protein